MKITEEEAKAQWNHIELDPPEGDLAIQLTIHCDQVPITIPLLVHRSQGRRGIYSGNFISAGDP
jgi:hypothetical protein